MKEKDFITITTIVEAPIEKVWEFWTNPNHIIEWNNASDEWHTPYAENDFRIGGKFLSKMESKDGKHGFEFFGIYDDINLYSHIFYTLGDGRRVKITFNKIDNNTKIIELFETESTYSIEDQQNGWQAILDNFKKYTEKTIKKVDNKDKI